MASGLAVDARGAKSSVSTSLSWARMMAMGKYDGLGSFLAREDQPMIELGFDRVDELVGGLPPSARRHRPWWANSGHTQAAAWAAVGWRVDGVDFAAGRVRFVRARPRPHGAPEVEAVGRPIRGPVRLPPNWVAVWEALCVAMAAEVTAGRGHLLTEDRLRWALISALEAAGVESSSIALEVRDAQVGGPLDLVIGSEVAFELKFPRDARSGASPDSMTFGELLRDFYRLARVAMPQRFVVEMIGDRLRRHLERRSEVAWTWTPPTELILPAGLRGELPATAAGRLPAWTESMTVTARCEYAATFGGWTLAVYSVDS